MFDELTAFKPPRILKDPVNCILSALKKKLRPYVALNSSNSNTAVRFTVLEILSYARLTSLYDTSDNGDVMTLLIQK